MSTTRMTQHMKATRESVYRALTDARAVQRWQVPDGMTSEVHEFDVREGGTFRISLTYHGDSTGKSGGHTDTFHGHFVKLVENEQIVEVMEFETSDPELQGEMTVTYVLRDADGGTELHAVHDHVPAGVSHADNETGWRMSLGKLARLVEEPARD
jgi:uncharacterized protein YndB with AHSA1/START domain